MKLRLLPFISSFLISAVVLFGGWFAYQSIAVETPLISEIEAIPGVAKAEVTLAKDKVNAKLQLTPEADIKQIIAELQQNHHFKQRHLQLQIVNATSSPALEAWWGGVLFEIAEAMESGSYSQIPAILSALQKQHADFEYTAHMDEDNVYLYLKDEANSKFITLPRVSRMGVWPHE